MEENIEQEPIKNQKGSYITGIIGALIGGAIASIPWILTYSFANMIVAVLATLIAGGAFLGYKIFKGKIGKGLPAIITIVSVIVITVVTLVICPMILLAKEGLEVNRYNFQMLYSASEMRAAIIQDLIMSLLFTVLGIAAVVRSISIQIKNGTSEGKLQFNTNAVLEESRKQITESCEIIKKVCSTLNCMNKENSAEKQEIMNELEMTHNIERKKAKQYFAITNSIKLLKKHKGKYYYDETDEQKKIDNVAKVNYDKGSFKTLIWIIIIAVIVGVLAASLTKPSGESFVIPNTDIEIKTTSDQFLYDTKEEIAQYFGEEYANYYAFVVLDGVNNEYEIYGAIGSKTEIGEEYDVNSLIQADRDYIATYWGEENTTQPLDIKLGENNFKTYNYKYSNEAGNQYMAVIYLGETSDQYLWLDFYADSDFETTRANEIMNELFK